MEKIDVGCEVENAVMGGVEQSALSGQKKIKLPNDLQSRILQYQKDAVEAVGGEAAYYRQQYECKF